MRIAVDLDGVLANTIVKFCEILNDAKGWRLTPKSFTEWSAWKRVGIPRDVFYRTLDSAWFNWQSIPPTEKDVANRFLRLKRYGRVDIVTGRSRQTVPFARAWLRRNGITYSRFVVTPSTIAKARLGYDVFIDDSSDLMTLLSRRNDCWGILYTQPWNQNDRTPPRIYRAKKWRQIADLMHKIQVEKVRLSKRSLVSATSI